MKMIKIGDSYVLASTIQSIKPRRAETDTALDMSWPDRVDVNATTVSVTVNCKSYTEAVALADKIADEQRAAIMETEAVKP